MSAENSPKPYHHGSVRESALAAGLAHLKEAGVEGFSLREVARRLGVTPTALYHHFPDKSDLLKALAEEGLRQFQDLLFAIPRNKPRQDYLTEVARSYVLFFLERPYYLNLIFSHHFKVEGKLLDNRQNLFQFLIEILVEQGIPSDKAASIGLWLWAAVHGLTTMFDTGILGVETPPCTIEPAKLVFHQQVEQLLDDLLPQLGLMIRGMMKI